MWFLSVHSLLRSVQLTVFSRCHTDDIHKLEIAISACCTFVRFFSLIVRMETHRFMCNWCAPKSVRLHGQNCWSIPLQAWSVYDIPFIRKAVAVQSFSENIAELKTPGWKHIKIIEMMREFLLVEHRFNAFTVTQLKLTV